MLSGSPTYWLSDPPKLLDFMDIFVLSKFLRQVLNVGNSDDLSSDHTPIRPSFNTTVNFYFQSRKLWHRDTDLAVPLKLLLNLILQLAILINWLKAPESLYSTPDIFDVSHKTLNKQNKYIDYSERKRVFEECAKILHIRRTKLILILILILIKLISAFVIKRTKLFANSWITSITVMLTSWKNPLSL